MSESAAQQIEALYGFILLNARDRNEAAYIFDLLFEDVSDSLHTSDSIPFDLQETALKLIAESRREDEREKQRRADLSMRDPVSDGRAAQPNDDIKKELGKP